MIMERRRGGLTAQCKNKALLGNKVQMNAFFFKPKNISRKSLFPPTGDLGVIWALMSESFKGGVYELESFV